MTKFLEKLQKIKIRRSSSGKANLNFLPEDPGIYIFYLLDRPIYIGKAINLKRRVGSYFDLDLDPKTRKMISQATHVSFIQVTSELEALLLEAKLIRNFMPRYNIAAKDDKHPLYILITKERFPRIITGRKADLKSIPLKEFYGPFPSSRNVRQVLRMLRKIFPYAEHKIGKRPCLYSHIGLCNPCPSFIEAQSDPQQRGLLSTIYLGNIRHIKAILDGKIDKVRGTLEKEMNILSKNEDYEQARILRDQIKRLEYIIQPQLPVEYFMENPNLYQDLREKELKDLKKILDKYKIAVTTLKRIECFDVAHLAGASPTASMVTFTDAEVDKNFYRHFRINQNKKNSDVDSLKEVIKRRLNHLDDWGRPDLIMVDGGKPQVGVFVRELEKFKIPVVGLAKRFETLVIPTRDINLLKLNEYKLPKGAALNLVQRLRDEAHRFARRYHHKLLSNRIIHEKPA